MSGSPGSTYGAPATGGGLSGPALGGGGLSGQPSYGYGQPSTGGGLSGPGYGSAWAGGGNTQQPFQQSASAPYTPPGPSPQNNIGLPGMKPPMHGGPTPPGYPGDGHQGPFNPQSSLYGPSGPPAGWVPDPNRQSGVRPWDSQIPGFDPTHFDPSAQQQPGSGFGFYRPPPASSAPGIMPQHGQVQPGMGLRQGPFQAPPQTIGGEAGSAPGIMPTPSQPYTGAPPGMQPPTPPINRDPYAGMRGYNPMTGRFSG